MDACRRGKGRLSPGDAAPPLLALLLPGSVFRVPGFGCRVSVFDVRVSGLRLPGFGFEVSVFDFRVAGLGFTDSICDFGGSAPGLEVSGFEFRVQGLRFSVEC